MFRKYYKEANDSIKPDEAFMLRVIENAKKRKPPAYARYTKYAAGIAAAVVIVSGTVLSMPLWQRVTDNTDGVIIEETITDNTADTAAPAVATAAPAASPQKTAAPEGAKSVNSSESKPKPTKIPSQSTSERSYSAFGESAATTEPPLQPAEEAETETVSEPAQTQTTADSNAAEVENIASDEEPMLKRAVLGDTDAQMRVESAPEDMAPYGAATDASEASSAKMAAIPDNDIPTPAGYYCTSAQPNGYTFVNDDGAVITVMINYGGEEREPYVEENGDKIYAVFTSFGLSVTINASGADRAAVEEIIESLR